MNKRKLIAITVGAILTIALIGGISSCSREEVVYQQQAPQQQVVYVQDSTGKWIDYMMFMHIMNTSGRPYNINNYHFSTRGTNGQYKTYKPNASQFNQMKSGKFTGKTMVARPPVAMTKKTNIFGKSTTTVGTPNAKKGGFFVGNKAKSPISKTSSKPNPIKSMFGGGNKTSSKSSISTSKSSSSGKVSSFGGSSSRASGGGFGG